MRPTTFASGTATMSGGWKATMWSNVPSIRSSTARAPKRVARMRSKLVGGAAALQVPEDDGARFLRR